MFRTQIAAALLLPLALQSQASNTTFISQVRVFDGLKIAGTRDVIIRDGKIAAMGARLAAPRELFDSHTHAFGSALADAIPFGVTTELDMFTQAAELKARKDEQTAGRADHRADLWSAGILVTAPRGHGTEYGFPIPTISSPDSAQAFVDARLAEGSDYIKIVYDDGSAYGRSIPTISRATLDAVIRATHVRRKRAVVHVGTYSSARVAIEAGADGLVHLFTDHDPDPSFGKLVASRKAFVVPTLTVLRSVAGAQDGAAIAADPRLAPYMTAATRGSMLARLRPSFRSAGYGRV